MIHKKHIRCLLLPLLGTLLLFSLAHGDERAEKRKKIRYAINKGILTPYDIPFRHYAALDMWDEIDFILAANNGNAIMCKMPGKYYSRPYVISDRIWVFKNGETENAPVYVFDPASLRLADQLKNKQFQAYQGGIRTVINDHVIIAGGANTDVDMAVIWNTRTDEVRTLKLEAGHYIGAIAVEMGKLYIGSCGGKINVWDMDDLSFLGTYSTRPEETTDWDAFNRQACITGIHFFNNRLIGVGERDIFIWDIDRKNLVKTYEKALKNSLFCFFEGFIAEYKNDVFALSPLLTGDAEPDGIRVSKAENPIVDLQITPEKLLPNQKGPVIVMSMRHNMGMRFYDFNTLELLDKAPLRGDTLQVYQNRLFATDDQNIYRYDIRHKKSGPYREFLKTIAPDPAALTPELYQQLLKRACRYPHAISPNALSEKFLARCQLSLHHGFRYGKIGEQRLTDEAGEPYREEVFGYNLFYEIRNDSDQGRYITLKFDWGGEYGRENRTDASLSSATRTAFIPPHGGREAGHMVIGEKEPRQLFVYPLDITEMSAVYYQGLQRALGRGNQSLSLVNTYLRDKRLKKWHSELKKRKKSLSAESDK
ncbi:hypothetical protein DENIS_4196 [Desulfonema ishimotonii]|uniref:WD40 repeat domain-containing protein n=1 Tax=Desulfonema ishimotonii TaxID=45657 RepID=A0A401G1V0_9BACT|nr:hypothetical protein [Desulfonema ishimotonii]GBC63202.1 hypothetical protein DENIS_4196 [Desulfonema ishimotonii]